jgi:RES domain-containing protein
MPRALWTWEVDVEAADLSGADQLAAVGLAPPVPGRRTWPPYQRVGERLWREGWAGLVAPSAARPEGRVLCLFRTADEAPGARPVGRARIVHEPPAPPTGMTT